MDVEQARTYLAVIETGSFMAAAERVHVTQSTVSMRIRGLENMIGRPLFQRSKAGASLTPAGARFEKYARTILRAWQQARHETALPDDLTGTLSIGAEFSLWDNLLVKWIPWIKVALPSLAISTESAAPDTLIRRLGDGLIDLVVTYTAQNRSGLISETLFEEELLFVTTDRQIDHPGHVDYIFVDWGPEFLRNYAQAFPQIAPPRLTVSHGQLGFLHMMENGGAGYFPARMVESGLKSGSLNHLDTLPRFSQPVYLVYGDGRDDDVSFQTAIQGMRLLVAQ